jgi:hypothetical protein
VWFELDGKDFRILEEKCFERLRRVGRYEAKSVSKLQMDIELKQIRVLI